MRGVIVVLFSLWFVGFAVAGEFTGHVIGILEGDTIEVLHKKRAERIRLIGIDCPEKRQPFGEKAKHAATSLVFGKDVSIQTHGKDKHRRTLAEVLLSDGTSLNQALVAGGWCWWYPKYAINNSELKRLESQARLRKRGLWTDPYPVPPWEWRKWRERPDTRAVTPEASELIGHTTR